MTKVTGKILYGLYFLLWIVFLLLAIGYFTDKYYCIASILLPVVGIFTLSVTIIILISISLIYIFKPPRRIRLKRAVFICLIPILFFIPLVVIYFIPHKLEDKKQEIELIYINWACDCANWATKAHIEKYTYSGDTLADLCVFVEPASKLLELPDSIVYGRNYIRFTGQFYKKKGFPKGYHSCQHPNKARVFRYTKYSVVKSDYNK